jgi:hypothetical protein
MRGTKKFRGSFFLPRKLYLLNVLKLHVKLPRIEILSTTSQVYQRTFGV